MSINMEARDRRVWETTALTLARQLGRDAANRILIPILLENRHKLAPDDPVHELLDQWDPATESFRDEGEE